jgi:hypothetical protein
LKKKYFTARNGGGGISFRFSNFPRASEREQRAHTHTHIHQNNSGERPVRMLTFPSTRYNQRPDKRKEKRLETLLRAAQLLLLLLLLLVCYYDYYDYFTHMA